MVLGQYGAVLVGTWWYWVSVLLDIERVHFIDKNQMIPIKWAQLKLFQSSYMEAPQITPRPEEDSQRSGKASASVVVKIHRSGWR